MRAWPNCSSNCPSFFPPCWVYRDLRASLRAQASYQVGSLPQQSNAHSHSLLHNSAAPLEKAVSIIVSTIASLAMKAWPKVNFENVCSYKAMIQNQAKNKQTNKQKHLPNQPTKNPERKKKITRKSSYLIEFAR